MSTTIQVPDYLRSIEVPESSEMITQKGSMPRISIRGQKFRWILDGEEIKVEKDSSDIVILGVEPPGSMARTFYINGYTPGSDDPPDCSSWDGIRPDSRSDHPQSDLCANCPQNAWGSATSIKGKKAKACKESKKLLVVPADDINGTIFILTVTISSLKALSEYGKWLTSNNLPYSAVVTTLTFADSDFPQLIFTFKKFLDEEEGKKCIARSQEREWFQDFKALSGPSVNAKSIEHKPKTSDVELKDSPEKVEIIKKSTEDLLNDWEDK